MPAVQRVRVGPASSAPTAGRKLAARATTPSLTCFTQG